MKVYKVRHIPTGLFWKNSRSGSKSNLHKDGKIWTKKPSVGSVGQWSTVGRSYHHPLPRDPSQPPPYRDGCYYQTKKILPEEWEVVEFELKM